MLFVVPRPKPVPAGAPVAEESQPAAPGEPAQAARAPAPAPAPAPSASARPAAPAPDEAPLRTVRVERPLYVAELSTRGAALTLWELRTFQTSAREGQQPIRLVGNGDSATGVLLTPLRELGLGSLAERNFELEREDGQGVEFRYASAGIVVRKSFSFDEEGYGFRVKLRVENASERAVSTRFGVESPLHAKVGQDFHDQALAALHEGSVTRTPLARFGTPSFFSRNPSRVTELPRELDWAAIDMPYFLNVVVPDQPAVANARFEATEPGRAGVVELYYDNLEIPPGQSAERDFRGYAGPKDQKLLEAMGNGLIRAIDLGYTWVVPLTRFFHWLLQALYSVIPNYGIAIIVLTVLVRLVTAPLTARQMRSMERMRRLSPKLEEIRTKYQEDRQKQSEEMMKLYRQEGVNPLGGCLPMVLQIPVFIGLFYALRSSIELRHSPFVGWIDDLSVPDQLFVLPGLQLPVRVLPLLMGASMVVQQRLTPMQVDPAQARMMMIVMPVMMTVMFYQFPSGLVLYWMVSNVLAISHQLWVGRGLRTA
jgi:YidC/Oxa1 family membrane protein insertase